MRLWRNTTRRHWNYFVAGPWNHGGWASGPGSSLGQIPFGSETAKYFREKIQAAWFAYWLKDEGRLPFEKAMTFETGTNEWKTYGEWPPRQGIQTRKLYFQADGGLSFDPPSRGRRGGFRQLCFRPRASGTLPPSADPAHRRQRRRLDDVASGRSAIRPETGRRSDVANRSAYRKPHRDRGPDGSPVRFHQRHRQRLGREAHRRLSR